MTEHTEWPEPLGPDHTDEDGSIASRKSFGPRSTISLPSRRSFGTAGPGRRSRSHALVHGRDQTGAGEDRSSARHRSDQPPLAG
jgi:hypothetical protein